MEAFSKIASFISHEPRCFNCHGGVNPHMDGVGRDPEDPTEPTSIVEHGGGKQPREFVSTGEQVIPVGCKECHGNMAPKRDGSPSRWMTAPPFMAFVGKDAPALCKQVRRRTTNAKEFIGHLKDDNGDNNFAATAFKGNRGLDADTMKAYEVKIESPSISHEEFVKLGQNWLDTMGGEFQGDSECGCVPLQYVLRLTATAEYNTGPGGSGASRMNVDIPITFADDGSFTGHGTAMARNDVSFEACQGTVSVTYGVRASGRAIETPTQQSMHIHVAEDPTVKGTATAACPGGTVTELAWRGGGLVFPSFDLEGRVGESSDRRVTQHGIATKLLLEIVRRDEQSR